LDRPDQVHAIASATGRDIVALFEHVSGHRPAIRRVDHHRKKHNIAFTALKKTRVPAFELAMQKFRRIAALAYSSVDVFCLVWPKKGHHAKGASSQAGVLEDDFDFLGDKLGLRLIHVLDTTNTVLDINVHQRRVDPLGCLRDA
jgi:hypothetical protein